MNINQIKKVRVYEQVIEQIKDSIEQGQIHSGQKLPSERELAVLFHVSRSVIREAMSVLNASGVLDIRPGIGVFLADDEEQLLVQRMNRVLKKDSVHVLELIEVRQGLEGQAAYLAAQRATPKDMEKIKQALHALESAVMSQDVAANEDFAFHAAIIRASKNETIIEMTRLLSDRFLAGLNESRSESLKEPKKAERVLREHRAIFQAIADKDAEYARSLMLGHLENVKISYEKSRKVREEYGIQS